jgi:type VI secretion system protein ImpC
MEPIAGKRIWRVDFDSFETALAKLNASLSLSLSKETSDRIELKFESVDHFHPDQLLKRVSALAKLLDRRKRLLDPATSAAAATELESEVGKPSTAEPASAPTASSSAPAESNDETMTRLLGGVPARPAPAPPQAKTGLDNLLKQIVSPHLVQSASAQQTALVSAVELNLSEQLRALLHHPHFQALEAVWRGLDRLVRGFGGEENIKLFVLDVSKEELAADLTASEALESSAFFKLIRQQTEDVPWSVALGLYNFSDNVPDLTMLGRVAKIFAAVGTGFIAGGNPHLIGCDSFAEHPDPDDWQRPISDDVRVTWNQLRDLSEADWIGLAMPRFLLRQPYGKADDPIDSFPFEELPGIPPHEAYLWGNPALLCGQLLLSSFLEQGWDMEVGPGGDIEELPVHTFSRDGEKEIKPCGEAWLSDRAGEAIQDSGLIPVLSIKRRDAVHLPVLQSLRGAPIRLG